MKKWFLVLIVLLLCGCGANKESANGTMDYDAIANDPDIVIVDVRTQEEYASLHVKDAINIPLDTIDENINLDKEKKIYVYCKSGIRSKQAYDKLKDLGYDVFDLGGIDNIDIEKESS